MTKITKDIDKAVKEILSGDVVGLPTETVYGLAANALNEMAVLKIYETKDRPEFNPVIVHIHDKQDIDKYAVDIPTDVYKLAEIFSPGPVTFVLKKNNIIPDIVTAGSDSIGLRIPLHPVFRKVLIETKLPLAAPSANRSGKISPTTAEDVWSELEGKINYIVDGGKCEIGIESTIISFVDEEVKILRHGFVTREEIEKVIGKISDGISERIISPGLLKSHYAPQTPLFMTDDPENIKNNSVKNIGILDFGKYKDQKEIALNLFSDLREMDNQNFDFILWSKLKDEGLGIAINDRLMRASSAMDNLQFTISNEQ